MSRATMPGCRRCARRCASSRRGCRCWLSRLGLPALRPHLAQFRDRRAAHGDARRAGRRVRPTGGGADHGERRDPDGAAARPAGRGELHRRGREPHRYGGVARLSRAHGLPAVRHRHRARRFRGARRADRHLSQPGARRAGAARSVRRRARQRAALRSRDPAHHREGGAGGTGAGVGGDPRRGRRSSGSASRYREHFGAGGHDDPLYEAISAGRKHQGYEHWLPFFHDRLETLFDYLPGAPVLLDDQVGPTRAGALGRAERRL